MRKQLQHNWTSKLRNARTETLAKEPKRGGDVNACLVATKKIAS